MHYPNHRLSKLNRRLSEVLVGIPLGTNCAPLVADLFLLCYERDFMLSLSDNNQADIVEAFNSTLRYLDDRSKAVLLMWIFYVFVLSCV